MPVGDRKKASKAFNSATCGGLVYVYVLSMSVPYIWSEQVESYGNFVLGEMGPFFHV